MKKIVSLLSVFLILNPIEIFSQGNTCADAVDISTFPYTAANQTTCNKGADFNTICELKADYTAGQDGVYKFKIPLDTCVLIKLSNLTATPAKSNISVSLYNGCPDASGSNCLEQKSINYPYSPEILLKGALVAGKTYYIVVDAGKDNDACLTFDLKINYAACAPPLVIGNEGGVDCGSNLGFEQGTALGWTGTYNDDNSRYEGPPIAPPVAGLYPATLSVNGTLGACGKDNTVPPNSNTTATPRHTLTSGTATDPNTDNLLPIVAPGAGKYSFRLGNQEPNRGCECVQIKYKPDPAMPIFSYLYAIISNDNPKHSDNEKARFELKIKDEAGNLLPCGGEYTVTSGSREGDGFRKAKDACGNDEVWWSPWRAVSIDLSNYMNQTLTIQFCTADCSAGGHYSYTYIDAYCYPKKIKGATLCSTTGSVTLTAPIGFTNYTWYYGPPPVSGAPIGTGQVLTLNNVVNGSVYTVTYENFQGICPIKLYSTDTIKIFNTAVTKDTALCNNSTGIVKLKATSIDPTTIYVWTPATNLSCTNCAGPDLMLPLSSTTTYSVTMSNQLGCKETKTVIITVQPCEPSVILNAGVICPGACTTIIANAMGGSPPYTYSWDPNLGSTAGPYTICPTTNTTYSVVITDANGKKASDTAIVSIHPAPSITVNTGTICAGEPFTLTANGGNNYSWSTGEHTQSIVVHPTTTTSYTVIGTSVVGCSDTTSTIITVNPKPVLTSTSAIVCVGTAATLSVNSDIPGTSFSWTPLTGLNISTGTSVTSNSNTTITYSITGTWNGCTSSITATKTVNPQPQANFASTPLCLGNPTQFMDSSSITTGTITSWFWNFGDGKTSTAMNPSHTYTNTSTFTVTLIVISDQGCADTIIKLVTVYPVPVIQFGPFDKGCSPLCTNFTDSSTMVNGLITKWFWNLGDNSTSSVPHPTHCYTLPGTYDVSLTVISDKGCMNSKTIDELVSVYPTPKADFSASPQPTTIFNPTIFFKDLSNNNPISWQWTFWNHENVVTKSMIQYPSYTYSDTGTYKIQLVVSNAYGCADTIIKYVIIGPEWSFYIANTFTPDGDGINDFFIGKGWNVLEHQMWIFDRWGNMIYTTGKTKDPQSAVPWNGRANNGADIAQIDTYVWMVILKDIKGMEHKYIGHVNLVK
jgi:gliding motility-associated-like protein